MSEQKKMTGIQRFVLAMSGAAMKGAIQAYAELTKEEREALHKRTAKRMFNKAMQNKLTEPYDEYEIEYIKEGLGIRDTSE